jgi:glutamine---fructose-6-phosphate transaminase (isomerizing)
LPDAAREGMLATLARLADAGVTVIAIEAGGTDDAHRLAVAKGDATLLEPIVMIHRFYRLAEALALRLGRDPDRPRNLRKVTETL